MYDYPKNNFAAPPQQVTEGFKSLKELTRLLIIACNERVRQFYVSKLSDRTDLKNDLIAFVEDFADLYLNTAEIMRADIGKETIEFNNTTKTVDEWCNLADDWIQMKKYDDDVTVYTIFKHGTFIYKAYVKALVKAEIYEA